MKRRRLQKRICLTGMFLGLLLFAGALWGNAQEAIKISHGPYLQAMTESGVVIVWTTNKPATAWVELAPDDGSHFYKEERPKYFSASNGLKNVGTVHQVQLRGLKPGTRYRYRVYSQEVLKHEWVHVQYGNVAATAVYQKKPLTFQTNGVPGPFEFAVVNDIHERNPVLKQLLGQVDFSTVGFVVFNGDMVSSSMSEEQVFKGFMDTATLLFASEVPMYYARGNHETRGPFAAEFPKYFPGPNGQLYYSFTKGDACFIVLDGGEDKPDSDIEYSGITDMDAYRNEQTEWLRNIVKTEAFRNAKYKIAICHIPPADGWHGSLEIKNKWVPILNEAGIQVMLSAHEHRHRIEQASASMKFPVIVNSNNNIIKAKITSGEASFSVYDLAGKLVDKVTVK
ncbi:FN3 domain-containing metallophosphoesterase family protein [Niabella drilacis]|uniref:Purple acid Phosphatase, N-terminal domain n=1 Tax=Niabella drilacis (strain DSM 25811 / CCM 8410 / CCUG 62505 / LMG 26954 / E90) TaxID=1285928 RepID=A0A1G6KLJ2_NIADE|nr:FN3 domain-containing metallophosphoesterase family protein [Niabella drilacis]SDC31787.1 Purple acid Phosphatase, N-terminal domain [Niabella drilacis]